MEIAQSTQDNLKAEMRRLVLRDKLSSEKAFETVANRVCLSKNDRQKLRRDFVRSILSKQQAK